MDIAENKRSEDAMNKVNPFEAVDPLPADVGRPIVVLAAGIDTSPFPDRMRQLFYTPDPSNPTFIDEIRIAIEEAETNGIVLLTPKDDLKENREVIDVMVALQDHGEWAHVDFRLLQTSEGAIAFSSAPGSWDRLLVDTLGVMKLPGIKVPLVDELPPVPGEISDEE